MIKITVFRNPKEQITAFTVDGHAGFAAKGEDIVCAAVSVLTIGTVNALADLLHIPLTVQAQEEDGFLHCVIPTDLDEKRAEKAQLLLEAMLHSLKGVAAEYKEHVCIHQEAAGKDV